MRGGRLGEPKRLREKRGVEGLSSPGLTKRTSKRLPQRTIMLCFSAAVVHFVQGLSLTQHRTIMFCFSGAMQDGTAAKVPEDGTAAS